MNCQKEKCCVVRVAIPDADSSDRVSPQAPAGPSHFLPSQDFSLVEVMFGVINHHLSRSNWMEI